MHMTQPTPDRLSDAQWEQRFTHFIDPTYYTRQRDVVVRTSAGILADYSRTGVSNLRRINPLSSRTINDRGYATAGGIR